MESIKLGVAMSLEEDEPGVGEDKGREEWSESASEYGMTVGSIPIKELGETS